MHRYHQRAYWESFENNDYFIKDEELTNEKRSTKDSVNLDKYDNRPQVLKTILDEINSEQLSIWQYKDEKDTI